MKCKSILKTMLVLLAVMACSKELSAITKGNTTTTNASPNGTNYSYTHDHDGTGDNHVLVAMVVITNGSSWGGWPTYNGVAPDHTSINVNLNNGCASKVLVMAWDNPPTGSNTFQIFHSNMWNKLVSICQSYSDATFGNIATTIETTNSNSQTLSMTTGSMAFVCCVTSSGVTDDITVDGTRYTSYDVNASTGPGKRVSAVTSNTIVAGGTITIETDCTSASSKISNHRVELLDDAGAVIERRVIIVN
jgi:hypothetical protein